MQEDIKLFIGKRVRYFRKSCGYTITELGALIHKGKSTISKYENGEISIDIDTLYDIAHVFNISPTCLLPLEDIEKDIAPPMNTQQINPKILYFYNFNGLTHDSLRKNILLVGNSVAELYTDVSDYKSIDNYNWYYRGKVQKTEATVRLFLTNPLHDLDVAIILYPVPLNHASMFYGFYTGISIGQYPPFSTKCLISYQPIHDDELLKKLLLLSPNEIKGIKRNNVFCFSLLG